MVGAWIFLPLTFQPPFNFIIKTIYSYFQNVINFVTVGYLLKKLKYKIYYYNYFYKNTPTQVV